MPKSLKFEDQYPELYEVAEEIAHKTILMINEKAPRVKSKMPYKIQHVLEEVIKILEGRV